MARTFRAWVVNQREAKRKSVRNLQYGPRTRLIRGISIWSCDWNGVFKNVWKTSFQTQLLQTYIEWMCEMSLVLFTNQLSIIDRHVVSKITLSRTFGHSVRRQSQTDIKISPFHDFAFKLWLYLKFFWHALSVSSLITFSMYRLGGHGPCDFLVQGAFLVFLTDVRCYRPYLKM